MYECNGCELSGRYKDRTYRTYRIKSNCQINVAQLNTLIFLNLSFILLLFEKYKKIPIMFFFSLGNFLYDPKTIGYNWIKWQRNSLGVSLYQHGYTSILFPLMLAFLIRTAGVPLKNDSRFISVNYIPHLEYFQKQSHEYAFLAHSCRFSASASQLQTLSRPPICAVHCARF